MHTPPSNEFIREQVVKVAVQEGLITPYTCAVGVCLRRDPIDPTQVKICWKVPLKTPHGRITHGSSKSTEVQQKYTMVRERSRTATACAPQHARGYLAMYNGSGIRERKQERNSVPRYESLDGGAEVQNDASKGKTTKAEENLTKLNAQRTTEGYWQYDTHLLTLLLSNVCPRVKCVPPIGVEQDRWMTIVALMYLRRHLSLERSRWEGMESKALVWLKQNGRDIDGKDVITAMQIV